MNEVLDSIDPCIIDHMAADLQKLFVRKEILEALYQISSTKSLRPDGMLA